MMTEDEAKQKWCPFARVSAVQENSVTPSFNRAATKEADTMTPAASKCIGSACMAWRWSLTQPPGTGFDAYGRPNPRQPDIRGFCGLAGTPNQE